MPEVIVDRAALWAQTSFCACSYLKAERSVRHRLVSRALATWRPVLELPFNERVFLDDHSPERAASQVLGRSAVAGRFDRVVYNEKVHPPNCNFGTVYSLEAARGPFILHLDDDIQVRGTVGELRAFLEPALVALASDERLLGINIFKLTDEGDYSPGSPSADLPGFTHPRRYFGTAASIVRKSLLERVSVAEIEGYGADQPAYWERLVSEGPGRASTDFLVAPQPTPFAVSDDAWLFSSTSRVSLLGTAKYYLLKWFKRG